MRERATGIKSTFHSQMFSRNNSKSATVSILAKSDVINFVQVTFGHVILALPYEVSKNVFRNSVS